MFEIVNAPLGKFKKAVGCDTDHCTGLESHHHGQIGMAFPYRDFINSQVFQMPELLFEILPAERENMNLFNRIPTQMPRHILHSRVM